MALPKQTGIKAKELLAMLPLELLEQTAKETGVDKSVKKLFGKDMFLLLLLSVLDSERVSLRFMQNLYSNRKYQLLAGVDNGASTKFTSLSDRLMNIKAEYFEKIFNATYENLSQHFSVQEIKKHHIIRFDSTMMSASAKLLEQGMMVGNKNRKTKEYEVKQIKLTLGFDGLFVRNMKVFTEQQHLGEDIALAQTIAECAASKNSVLVFDRGLKKRTTFADFSKQGKLFVTRINPTQNYRVVKPYPVSKPTETLQFLSDEEIYFLKHEVKKLKVSFRLIKARQLQDGQILYFVTNITDMDTESITNIYKARWDIEVFFRFLKQELNLKHFLSYNLNGIKVMFYVTLIAAMLIMLYKKLNNLDGFKSAKQRFIEAIDTEITRLIVEICGGNPNKTTYLNST